MLLEECEELFGADDLYGVLHIENKKASAAEGEIHISLRVLIVLIQSKRHIIVSR